MKSIKRGKLKRRPSAPGEILKEIFLDGNEITQADFARELSALTKGQVKESTMKTKLSDWKKSYDRWKIRLFGRTRLKHKN